MKILVSGSSGFIGQNLVARLKAEKHDVIRLVRPNAAVSADAIMWDPAFEEIDPSAFEGFDAVIHLGGENVVGRWTDTKKHRIRESRVRSTRLLAQTLASLKKRPSVFLTASGIGYYGSRAENHPDEQSPAGDDFLAEVCVQWEAAVKPAEAAGIRCVQMRISAVLGKGGGVLAKMLMPFKLGLGGRIGSGKQFMSWISLQDLCHAILHCLSHEDIQGPVNAAAPAVVTNAEFTRQLGKVLKRPTIFPIPTAMVHALFGEMADSTLLASQNPVPKVLLDSQFEFTHPDLESALRDNVTS
jgi:uncharacterized protein (TIGR01777 family)